MTTDDTIEDKANEREIRRIRQATRTRYYTDHHGAHEFVTRCVCGIPSRTGLCEHLTEHHDTPAAPERGEWRYVETRYSAEVAVNDNLRLRAHWTGTWDRDEIRTLMQGVVTEHNQHSTLIAQRERLLEAARFALSTPGFIRGRDSLQRIVDEAITTSEQEGRTER